MNLSRIKQELVNNLKNIPGSRSSRKMVVFECDDWGGIRTPSLEAYSELVKKDLVNPSCRYRFDTLANTDDLESLFQTLRSVKDKNGAPAVMTPIVNVANPNFNRIKEEEYQNYYFEKFTDTLIKYGRGEDVFELWKKGIEGGVFVPELHGREHLAVQHWMKMLQGGNKDVIDAFDHGFISVELKEVAPAVSGFRAEFYMDSEDQVAFLQKSLGSGIELFEELFERKPDVFVPSNALFHPHFEKTLFESGVKYLNVWPVSLIPDIKGQMKKKIYINGSKGNTGIRYYIRNCVFEPSDTVYTGIDHTLKQMEAAFRWNKPAIISTHRVNFIGEIDSSNREYGLNELSKLLNAIVKRWPDVEFMSSKDMFNILY